MEIKVLGRPITIHYCSTAHLEEISGEKDCLGYFFGSTISIKQSLSSAEKSRIFLHEVLHAMISISGLSCLLEEETEEAICTLSESLADLFKDENFRDHL